MWILNRVKDKNNAKNFRNLRAFISLKTTLKAFLTIKEMSIYYKIYYVSSKDRK